MRKQTERKNAIRSFMQNNYTDERLAQLLAHARDGKLSYYSCCCFIGAATADHALQEENGNEYVLGLRPWPLHLMHARNLKGAFAAELAFRDIIAGDEDVDRRRILIPIIRAEMKRREWVRRQEEIMKEIAWA